MRQLAFLTPPLCNRCNAETGGGRCPKCGCGEFRLTGLEAAQMRAKCAIRPNR